MTPRHLRVHIVLAVCAVVAPWTQQRFPFLCSESRALARADPPAPASVQHPDTYHLKTESTLPPAAIAADVRAVRIDGTSVTGVWAGSPDGHAIELRTPKGMEIIAVDDLSTLAFDHAENRKPPVAKEPVFAPESLPDEPDETGESPGDDGSIVAVPVVFHLADGGHLYGDLLRSSARDDGVIGHTALGEAVTFGFDRLAGIQLADREAFPKADGQFQAALAARLPGHDVLITRSIDDVKTLRGRVEQLDPARGSFFFGRRKRTFATERIYGIVFAAGAGHTEEKRYPITLTLTDDSVFSGRIARADAYSLRVDTSVGVIAELPITDVTTIRVHSDRVIHVSDLSPVRERIEGLLHQSGDKESPWPVRWDRSVSGGPLAIGGRTFTKGIGVHSRTELAFAISGGYEKFVATIGLDDSVRPNGSVVFRVLGDGKVLFDSGEVTGADEPRDIIVDVSKVNTLTLVVDYGTELDLSGHADWGGTRLLKPTSGFSTGKDEG